MDFIKPFSFLMGILLLTFYFADEISWWVAIQKMPLQ